ncbi:MAG TPA: prepilin peptidase [Lentisphaeria bacterium]|nr:prepilin peptidase [Lentisphaeria bacterium]
MSLPSSLYLPLSVMVFCLGCIVGSFLNVVVWRVPRGESLLHPPSHCPRCGHVIRPWENIPILSWLFLRGKCSQCRLPISIRYPLGEAAAGILFLAVWVQLLRRGLPLEAAPGALYLAASLLAIAQIDVRHRLIPDQITYSGLVAALLLAIALPTSRLAVAQPDAPHSGAILCNGLLAWISAHGLDLTKIHIAAAVVDCILGAAIGAALLVVVAEAGRRLFGAKTIALPDGATVSASKQGLTGLDDDRQQPWEELLARHRDAITIISPPEPTPQAEPTPKTWLVNADGVFADGVQTKWADGEVRTFNATAVIIPRDVMGYGDVKCLAMIGAFCGADAAIYILLAAAALAALVGGAVALVKRRRQAMIPFGPFLAASALAWLLVGNFFFLLHQAVISKPG